MKKTVKLISALLVLVISVMALSSCGLIDMLSVQMTEATKYLHYLQAESTGVLMIVLSLQAFAIRLKTALKVDSYILILRPLSRREEFPTDYIAIRIPIRFIIKRARRECILTRGCLRKLSFMPRSLVPIPI